MTNKEALIAAIKPYETEAGTIEKTLIDAGIDQTAEYLDRKAIDLCAIEILQAMMSLSSESEGGFSRSYDSKGIKQRLLYLAQKNGVFIPGLGGSIKSIDKW